MSAPNQQRPRLFVDSSGPLFSMYSKAAEEEDRKMIERWRKDAEEILIFVSPQQPYPYFCLCKRGTDRFILRCRCRAARRDAPVPNPQQSRYLFILSRKHL